MGKFNLRVLLFLSCGHMVVDVYQGALPSILPFIKDNLGLTYTSAGVILIVANLTSSIIQPVFGYLSDRKARGFLLPIGVFLAGAGFAALPLARSYWWILLLVAVSGLGVAAYHPEGYKTARFFTGTKMATGMSVFSVGGNTGMAIGPILALSIVTWFGFDFLTWMLLPCVLFSAAMILMRGTFAIPAVDDVARKGAETGKRKGAWVALLTIIAIIIMRTWTHFGLITYIPFYYINYLKGDPVLAGKIVSLFLLGGAFGTLAGAPLADRWGHLFWIRCSMLVSALLFPCIFLVEGAMLLVVVTLFGMVLISTFSVTVVMGQSLMPGNLGMASGLLVGFAIGAGGIGVTLLGAIADRFGVPIALECIGVLPVVGLIFSMALRFPPRAGGEEPGQNP